MCRRCENGCPGFATIGQPVNLDDLVLFGDCYYLPHEEGPEAETLYERARGLLARNPADWGDEVAAFRQQATRLREFCVRMTELRERPLFYALSRRIWELREELDLLSGYIEYKSRNGDSEKPPHRTSICRARTAAEWRPGCSVCWSSNRTAPLRLLAGQYLELTIT